MIKISIEVSDILYSRLQKEARDYNLPLQVYTKALVMSIKYDFRPNDLDNFLIGWSKSHNSKGESKI